MTNCVLFLVGCGNADNLTSIGNRNSRQIATILRKIPVLSIEALFRVYPAVIPAGTKTSLIYLFSIAIVIEFFRKRLRYSTVSPLSLRLARIS